MYKRWLPLVLLGLLFSLTLKSTGFPTLGDIGALNTGDCAWMLTASALVLLMTPGLSFFYAGMVGEKNVISTMLQSFIAMGVVSILWVVCGFSLAFGDSVHGIVGNPSNYFLFNNVGASPNPEFANSIPFALFALFQLKFAIITPALITGALAERVRFSAYIVFMILFSIFIYPPLAHMTWHPQGLLRSMGVLDFAGGTVVHMSAGFAALAAALALGPRKSHLLKEAHQPAHVPYVLLGTGMLWFGWFGFNAGSALAANPTAVQAFITTNTASASAMLAWLVWDYSRGKKPSALGACIGAVVGLVAITPAAGYVGVLESIFIGAFSAIVSNIAVALRSKTEIDDTLDVFPCHGIGGLCGMLLTGIFAKDVGLLQGSNATFMAHLAAMIIVSTFCFFGSYIIFKITNALVPFRVSEKEELLGLDISQHGESIREYRESISIAITDRAVEQDLKLDPIYLAVNSTTSSR